MNRQSLDLLRPRHLPRYGDTEDAYEKGVRYIFRKKENATEPPITARALRSMDSLGDALEWANRNLGADQYLIVSV